MIDMRHGKTKEFPALFSVSPNGRKLYFLIVTATRKRSWLGDAGDMSWTCVRKEEMRRCVLIAWMR